MESEKPDPGAAPRSTGRQDAALPPTIDSVVLARKGEVLQGHLPLASMRRLLTAGVGAEGMLRWEVEGSTARDEMQRQREFLRVRTTFSPWMTCSRCLEPVQLDALASDTHFQLAPSEERAALEDRETESVEVIAAGPSLDLAALVEDEAILALPMAPAHDTCQWQAGSDAEGDV